MRNICAASVTASPLALSRRMDAGKAVDQMRDHWRSRIERVLPDKPDIIVLPENCDRPQGAAFRDDWYQEYLEARGDGILEMLSEIARSHRTAVAYPAHRRDESGRWFNSTRVIDSRGEVAGTYDKVFLTIGEHEEDGLTYGEEPVAIELEFGRVAPVICFDLNFEELRVKMGALAPDMLLFSSAFHGGYLQQHWAYSLRVPFVASVYPPAPSGILSATGEPIAQTTNYNEEVTVRVNLDADLIHLAYNEERFAEIKLRYGPRVRIHDPGRIGVVLISSEDENLDIDDVMDEFNLERVGDYFDRVRSHRTRAVQLR
jgi:predicted amidohydrolase